MIAAAPLFIAFAALAHRVAGHAAPSHPCFFGFNVTAEEYGYDNRMVAPLQDMPFSQWWMHNHMDKPPHPEDVCELNAGGVRSFEISCDKGFTSYYASSPGGDIRQQGNNLACPGQDPIKIHAANEGMTAGSAIGIAYKSDVHDVKPEDFVIISVKHDSPWYLNNDFSIPAGLPACPNGVCICAWFWIPDLGGGSAQMYMNAFQCKVTGQVGTTPLGKPSPARQCGPNTRTGVTQYDANNCTVGPKNPLYTFQLEGNNVNTDIYARPVYHDYYGFPEGAQNNLFIDSYVGPLDGAPPNTFAPAPATTSTPASSADPTPTAQTTEDSQAPASPTPETPESSPAPASPTPETPAATPVPASPSPETPAATPAPASPTPESPAASPTTASPTPETLVATPSPVAPPLNPAVTSVVIETPTVPSPIAQPTTSSATSVAAPMRSCKPRSSKKKRTRRSPVQRHLKKRLTHEQTH